MFARLRSRRALIIGVATVLALAALAVAPWALWHTAPERTMDVLVVDKTVAKADYRKHAGAFWVLDHEKVRQRSTGERLRRDRDYAGTRYTPDGEMRIVPVPGTPTDLTYIADTYGVYRDDLGEQVLGLRSPMITGGLSVDEVRTLLGGLRPGATLVGEFNCLATPTAGEARRVLERALGVRWTGWIGRHFSYLDLTVDMPLWIPRQWRRQTGTRWQFRGPGYVFVNEQGHLVVLVEGVDTPTPALRMTAAPGAADRYGISDRQTYDYWFEVMEAAPGAEVLATFALELTPSGRRKMRGVPVGRPFPAIVRTRHDTHLSYYFAGDFADQPNVPDAYRYRWLPEIRGWLGAENRDDQQAFFWRVYVPIMQRIIREADATARARGSSGAVAPVSDPGR